MENPTLTPLLKPFLSGKNIYYLEGGLLDLRLNGDGKIQKLETMLSSQLRNELDAVLLRFSLATGMDFNSKLLSDTETQRVNQFIARFQLGETFETPSIQFTHIVRQLFDIIKSDDRPYFDNGDTMQLAFLFQYADHLLPPVQPQFREDHQSMAIQLIEQLDQSFDLRRSSTYIILNGEGALDRSLSEGLKTVSIPYPDEEKKKSFLGALKSHYSKAATEEGLTDDQIIYLSKNTSNRSLEELFRASHYSGEALTASNLSGEREKYVLKRSEGTLRPVNTERVVNDLYGINIEWPQKLLNTVVRGIRKRDSRTPSNVLLVGPKSSGKSDLALQVALESGIPSYHLNSPRNKFVGETERLTQKMFDLLSYKFDPSIGIIDELELQFPMDRNKEYLDSGTSASVTGLLQEVLADRSRNGKSVLIGTSNRPTMGASMFERFDLVIPVLMPLKGDYPEIICGLAKTIEQCWTTSPNHPKIKEAARIFYSKHGSPRNILSAFKRAVTCFSGPFNENTVLETAKIMRPQANYKTAIYCDLLAIKLSGNETLPWFREGDYPFPDHIRKVMSGGEIDDEKLNAQISTLEPHANV